MNSGGIRGAVVHPATASAVQVHSSAALMTCWCTEIIAIVERSPRNGRVAERGYDMGLLGSAPKPSVHKQNEYPNRLIESIECT
jgi:hypothetical protein